MFLVSFIAILVCYEIDLRHAYYGLRDFLVDVFGPQITLSVRPDATTMADSSKGNFSSSPKEDYNPLEDES